MLGRPCLLVRERVAVVCEDGVVDCVEHQVAGVVESVACVDEVLPTVGVVRVECAVCECVGCAVKGVVEAVDAVDGDGDCDCVCHCETLPNVF